MLTLLRTEPENKDFINLVRKLDAYLKITDEEDHDFYNQFNNIDVLKYIVVVYKNNIAVGCGAIKHFDSKRIEIKRMFVENDQRGQGIASKILTELEAWAKELGYSSCILETGERQVEAVKLYHKRKYKLMNENYGQYKDVVNSLCFEKEV